MPSVEAVIFDIGHVLVEWHPERAYDALIGMERRQSLFAAVDLFAMNERADAGEDMAEVVAETAAKHPDYHDDILLWHTNWPDMLTPDIPGTAVLLRALRKRGVPVMALSNFGASTLVLADAMHPVLTEFDRRFISAELRLIKPDAAIYAHVEQETGLDPASLLFTDDKAKNVEAAAARGWQTHHFTGPDGLRDRLLAEGLLQPEDLPG